MGGGRESPKSAEYGSAGDQSLAESPTRGAVMLPKHDRYGNETPKSKKRDLQITVHDVLPTHSGTPLFRHMLSFFLSGPFRLPGRGS